MWISSPDWVPAKGKFKKKKKKMLDKRQKKKHNLKAYMKHIKKSLCLIWEFYTCKAGCPGDVEVKVLRGINDHVQISILLQKYK